MKSYQNNQISIVNGIFKRMSYGKKFKKKQVSIFLQEKDFYLCEINNDLK
jgi:hypothetical protein